MSRLDDMSEMAEQRRALNDVRDAYKRNTPQYDPVVALYLNHCRAALEPEELRRLTQSKEPGEEPTSEDLIPALVVRNARVNRQGRTKAFDLAIRGHDEAGVLAVRYTKDGELVDIDWLQ